ncbi:hypothetical protein POM88_007179 [Heracleum sosnowskyi]|uniref:Uncharacterized protein n=1 Tax=Heracleum sosnowskyi TaxID=360622 RepID=A0AAD8J6X6_9APIA|nr:hypothetical protein POM88_007179 [Heracleum sosnowskyi]
MVLMFNALRNPPKEYVKTELVANNEIISRMEEKLFPVLSWSGVICGHRVAADFRQYDEPWLKVSSRLLYFFYHQWLEQMSPIPYTALLRLRGWFRTLAYRVQPEKCDCMKDRSMHQIFKVKIKLRSKSRSKEFNRGLLFKLWKVGN